MPKLIKIQNPKFIDEVEKIVDLREEFIYNEKIQNKLIENTDIESKNDVGITIDSCVFYNSTFIDCSFERVDIIDTVFKNCDLSNVSFIGGSIHRTQFINCKLVGARFDECNFKNVLFENILGKYSNFSFSKINNVNFIESNMTEAILQEVKFEKTVFENCDLTNGFFNKTFLGKMDLTTCEISGIDVDIPNVYGTTVTTMQALDLSRLLGLNIK